MSECTPSAPSDHKRCSKDGLVKPLSEFGRQRNKDGTYRYRSACKACVNKYSTDRYADDPSWRSHHKTLRDRWRSDNPAYMAEYYQENRDQLIAAAIAYAKKNPPDPEQVRRWARERYAADPERHRAKDQAWRENNIERAREVGRRTQSRRRARMRGLPVEPYTMDQLLARDGTLCVLCDGELDLNAAHPDLLAPTVEHLECISWDNSAGDVPANCAVAHFTCNSSRNNRPHPAAARKRAELLAAEAQPV